MNRYSKEVVDRFLNPKHIGKLDVLLLNIGYAKVGSLSCGDILEVFIKIENDLITDVKTLIFGCGSAFAASERMAELSINKSLNEVLSISNKQIADDLSLPKIKLHCSVLAEEALYDAILNYFIKNSMDESIKKYNMVKKITSSYKEAKDSDMEISQLKCCDKLNSSIISESLSNSLKNNVLITDLANEKFINFFALKPNKALKITIVAEGCGFKYTYFIVDLLSETFNNCWIIDKEKYIVYVTKSKHTENIKIDLIEKNMENYIQISNSNSSSSCSCGLTFR